MPYQLGVDLGTTYTAAAVARDGNVEIANLGSQATTVPSVIFVREDDTILVGEAAARRALTEPARVVREFKRRFGDPTPIIVAGSPYAADALMAKLLSWVVEQVAAREGGPPERIALTYPANWGPYKQDLLAQALRIADVGDVQTVTEPEAAAISYAAAERVEPGAVVAVYDLGGGTFDAAVLRKTADGFELLGRPEGIEHLGGVDFDEAVFAHVRESCAGAFDDLDAGDPGVRAAVAHVRRECTEAKEALSADTEAAIPVLLTVQTQVRITRAEFEAMIRPTLAPTVAALSRAIASTGLTPEQVDVVLLAGGSSRIPLVGQLIAEQLGRPVAVDIHPKHAVALGAARWASHAEPPVGSVPSAPTVEPPPALPPPEPPPGAPPQEPPSEPTVPQPTAEDEVPTSSPAPTGRRRSRRTRALVTSGVGLLLVAGAAVALARGGGNGDGGGNQPEVNRILDEQRASQSELDAMELIQEVARAEIEFLARERRWSASAAELGLTGIELRSVDSPPTLAVAAVKVDGTTLYIGTAAPRLTCVYTRMQALQPTRIDFAFHRLAEHAGGTTRPVSSSCPALAEATYSTNGWAPLLAQIAGATPTTAAPVQAGADSEREVTSRLMFFMGVQLSYSGTHGGKWGTTDAEILDDYTKSHNLSTVRSFKPVSAIVNSPVPGLPSTTVAVQVRDSTIHTASVAAGGACFYHRYTRGTNAAGHEYAVHRGGGPCPSMFDVTYAGDSNVWY